MALVLHKCHLLPHLHTVLHLILTMICVSLWVMFYIAHPRYVHCTATIHQTKFQLFNSGQARRVSFCLASIQASHWDGWEYVLGMECTEGSSWHLTWSTFSDIFKAVQDCICQEQRFCPMNSSMDSFSDCWSSMVWLQLEVQLVHEWKLDNIL